MEKIQPMTAFQMNLVTQRIRDSQLRRLKSTCYSIIEERALAGYGSTTSFVFDKEKYHQSVIEKFINTLSERGFEVHEKETPDYYVFSVKWCD